jgi:hypothetical protein
MKRKPSYPPDGLFPRLVRLIHRSAWKGNSPKSVCGNRHTRHPEGQGRRRSGLVAFRFDHHMLWRCIEMPPAASSQRRVGPRGYPTRRLTYFLRQCRRATSWGGSAGGLGLRTLSGRSAAFFGVCGAPAVHLTSVAASRRAPGTPASCVDEGGSSRTHQNTNHSEIRFRVRATEGVPRLELAPM